MAAAHRAVRLPLCHPTPLSSAVSDADIVAQRASRAGRTHPQAHPSREAVGGCGIGQSHQSTWPRSAETRTRARRSGVVQCSAVVRWCGRRTTKPIAVDLAHSFEPKPPAVFTPPVQIPDVLGLLCIFDPDAGTLSILARRPGLGEGGGQRKKQRRLVSKVVGGTGYGCTRSMRAWTACLTEPVCVADHSPPPAPPATGEITALLLNDAAIPGAYI